MFMEGEKCDLIDVASGLGLKCWCYGNGFLVKCLHKVNQHGQFFFKIIIIVLACFCFLLGTL